MTANGELGPPTSRPGPLIRLELGVGIGPAEGDGDGV